MALSFEKMQQRMFNSDIRNKAYELIFLAQESADIPNFKTASLNPLINELTDLYEFAGEDMRLENKIRRDNREVLQDLQELNYLFDIDQAPKHDNGQAQQFTDQEMAEMDSDTLWSHVKATTVALK